MAHNEIQVGQAVRSFDFEDRSLEGPRACYVEGVVEGFREVEGCERYVIRVTRRVVRGVEKAPRPDCPCVFPPKNGTPTWLGNVCDGVESL